MKMTYYRNSDRIRDLMKSLAYVDVKPMDNSFEWTGLTLYIFDDLFSDRTVGDYCVGRECNALTLRLLWEKCPDWGGMI